MDDNSTTDSVFLSDIPFQLELGNDLLHSVNCKNLNRHNENSYESTSIESSRYINTGITYLSLPEPRLQFVKHQQSHDFKSQIKQDFLIRFRQINDEELNEMFSNMNKNDANRYITSYQYLYQYLWESTLKSIDINEEIIKLKHAIEHQNEILPVLMENRRLAQEEKKILYRIVTKTWRKFDERMQNEINTQNQLEKSKLEHQDLTKMKIKQEKFQRYYSQLQDMNIDIIHLKRGFYLFHIKDSMLESCFYFYRSTTTECL